MRAFAFHLSGLVIDMEPVLHFYLLNIKLYQTQTLIMTFALALAFSQSFCSRHCSASSRSDLLAEHRPANWTECEQIQLSNLMESENETVLRSGVNSI
jgi:hypothetical protein